MTRSRDVRRRLTPEARTTIAVERVKAALAEKAARAQAVRDADAKRQAVDDARFDEELRADLASSAAFNQALMELGAQGIERSTARAELVQKAASAILALYTAILGLAFSVTDQPLPLRGAVPAIFLGAAIVLSVGYLSFITRGSGTPHPSPREGTDEAALERTGTLLGYVNEAVHRRAPWLRTSVVALGIAVAAVPLPFLAMPAPTTESCPAGLELETSTGACLAPWPELPTVVPSDVPLAQALLAGQVEDVAAQREAARARAAVEESSDARLVAWSVLGGVLLLVAVFAVSVVRERRQRADVGDR